MQQDIHPVNNTIEVTCSCGNQFSIVSTLDHSLHLDVCNKCHPFYTKKKRETVSGRVEKFRTRYNIPKPVDKPVNT
jgi:large subunit ribosomal protein L31